MRELQPSGAFKIRGAYNMVAQLTDEQRRRGVVTFSSGNHGQAMALAARELGAPAVVVMPTTAPQIKIDGARGFGAEVIFAGTTSTERRERAEAEARARGLTMVPPFDHEWIIAGQGTAGLEILDQQPDVAAVIVPIGGGGLAAGVSAAIKLSRPDVKVIGVEPAGAAAMKASIEAGRPRHARQTDSVADGLLPVRPGDLTFALVRRFVDLVVTVEDEQIIDACCGWRRRPGSSWNRQAPPAWRPPRRGRAREGPTVAIISGGNMSRRSWRNSTHVVASAS